MNWAALAVALGFMLGAFGQIPINDYMIGKMAQGEARARVYAIRYVVSFTALAAALPLIAFVYEGWGFDTLFRLLAVTAFSDLHHGLAAAAPDADPGGCDGVRKGGPHQNAAQELRVMIPTDCWRNRAL